MNHGRNITCHVGLRELYYYILKQTLLTLNGCWRHKLVWNDEYVQFSSVQFYIQT